MVKVKSWTSYFFLFAILFFLLLKFYFASTGFLNFEGNFFELGRQIAQGKKDLNASLYFKYQANPIGTALIIAFFYSLLIKIGLISEFLIAKLPALLLMISALYYAKRLFGRIFSSLSDINASLFVLYFFIHPSVWAFTGRTFSDSYYILGMLLSFGLYSEYLLTGHRRFIFILVSVLSILFLIKFNTILIVAVLGLHFIYDLFRNRKLGFRDFFSPRLLIALAPVMGLLGYYGLAKYYNVPFTQNNSNLAQFSRFEFARNYILYNLHFFIIALPLGPLILYRLLDFLNKRQKAFAILLSLIAGAGYIYFLGDQTLMNTGELNFGGQVDRYVSKYYLQIVVPALFLATLHFVLLLQRILFQKLEKIESFIIFSYLSLVFLHSFVRPVQRYLLILIFFQIVHFIILYKEQLRYFIKFLMFALPAILLIDCALSYENKTKSDAYVLMGNELKKRDSYYVDVTTGPLISHLFGNIAEEYLLKDAKRKRICIFESGYVRNEPIPEFEVSTFSSLSSKNFILSAANCN